MEAGEKEEEETLQTAFKKLRVDAETSLPGPVNVCEALDPRAVPRACPEVSGAKPKLGCTKDPWHGCMRKTSRGVSRSQRRRRSKSPILHPPKFTYCASSSAASPSSPSSPSSCASSLSPPGGCLKHQRLAPPEPLPALNPAPSSPAPTASASTPPPTSRSPAVFGACAAGPAPLAPTTSSSSSTSPPEAPRDGEASQGPEPSDFQSLSQRHSGGPGSPPCSSCACPEVPEAGALGPACGCGASGGSCSPPPAAALPAGWPGVEVYSFTGLRQVISECERSLPAPRTPSSSPGAAAAATTASSSPRSCSEQARAYVDDITIEDLSGYMEYFLYIPKKMSHMAEMMYT